MFGRGQSENGSKKGYDRETITEVDHATYRAESESRKCNIIGTLDAYAEANRIIGSSIAKQATSSTIGAMSATIRSTKNSIKSNLQQCALKHLL